MVINLSLNEQEPYFTFGYHKRVYQDVSNRGIGNQLNLLKAVLQSLGGTNREIIIGTTTEINDTIDKYADERNIRYLPFINHGCCNTVKVLNKDSTLIDLSHAFPFYQLPSFSILVNAKSLGVPVDISILMLNDEMSYSGTSHNPDILHIYLLRKVLEDLNEKGIDQIKRETSYKAELLFHAIKRNPQIDLVDCTINENEKSKTVIAFFYSGKAMLVELLEKKGYRIDIPTDGNPFIINNFATHSKEQFEQLSDILTDIA